MNIAAIKIKSQIAPLSFQDKGRRGLAKYGVARSGVMDAVCASFANRMVGNYANEVLIEFAYGGVELEAVNRVRLAIVGAGGLQRTVLLEKGEVLKVPAGNDAVWGYIAIAGGWVAEKALGSSSFHERSKLGQQIKAGEILSACGEDLFLKQSAYVGLEMLTSLDEEKSIRVHRGPHAELLGMEQDFVGQAWSVCQQMDRTGYRIESGVAENQHSLKSFPIIPGCIQLTPSGKAIAVMPDGPTVGGYPVVAVIHPEDLGVLAQRGVGKQINFRWNDSD